MITDVINRGITIDCLSCGAVMKEAISLTGEGYKTITAICLSCGDRFEIQVGRRGRQGETGAMTLRLELQRVPKKRKARR